MTLNIVVGTQWGDEGKGRIVDLISTNMDVVARYSGGDNAGHTVTVGEDIFKLHLIPSGIVHPHTISILGNGMVINPLTILEEIDALKYAGVEITPERLMISPQAHLITPAHRLFDHAQDEARGKNRIGTTGRGIGPAYVDKASRKGLRVQDILQPDVFEKKVKKHIEDVSNQLHALFNQTYLNVEAIADEYIKKALQITPFIADTSAILDNMLKEGKNVLAEGAQGTLLDIDQGTYPFVTSSTTTAAGMFSGLGIGVQNINRIIGITKAFQTRVGAGPFPTETFEDKDVKLLRGTGENPWDEYGTTTGRPRRVGWLDGVLLKYAVRLNGLTEIALTKLDILTGLEKIKVCHSYQIDGKTYENLPFGLLGPRLDECTPVYDEVDGWQDDVSSVRHWDELPQEAKAYVKVIENICNLPVRYISVGPERNQVIIRED